MVKLLNVISFYRTLSMYVIRMVRLITWLNRLDHIPNILVWRQLVVSPYVEIFMLRNTWWNVNRKHNFDNLNCEVLTIWFNNFSIEISSTPSSPKLTGNYNLFLNAAWRCICLSISTRTLILQLKNECLCVFILILNSLWLFLFDGQLQRTS